MAWDSQVAEEDVALVHSIQRGLESGGSAGTPEARARRVRDSLISDSTGD
jgi:hypothetical protein